MASQQNDEVQELTHPQQELNEEQAEANQGGFQWGVKSLDSFSINYARGQNAAIDFCLPGETQGRKAG